MGTIQNIIDDKQLVKNQLGNLPDTVTVPKFFEDSFIVQDVVARVDVNNIAGSMIWGSADFGIWGTARWSSGSLPSFVLGSASFGVLGTVALGSRAQIRPYAILPKNNIYVEYFGQDDYIDTTATTATVSTSAETCTFANTEILQSDVVAKIRAPITTARITVDDPTNLTFELSNDSGATWESATHGAIHTFASAEDGDELKYRITATGAATIGSGLSVEVNP